MPDPDLMACWGRLDGDASVTARRQHLYLNLVLSHLETMFELGTLPEEHLRQGADSAFGTEPGRAFWAASGEARRLASGTRRGGWFLSWWRSSIGLLLSGGAEIERRGSVRDRPTRRTLSWPFRQAELLTVSTAASSDLVRPL